MFCSNILVLKTSDSSIATANLLVLFFVSVVPFTVSVILTWPNQFYAWLLVNFNLMLIGVFLLTIWFYSIHKRRFAHESYLLSMRTIRVFSMRFIFPPVVYGLSIIFAPLSNIASLVINISVAINFVIDGFGLDIFDWIYRLYEWIMRRFRKDQSSANEQSMTQELVTIDSVSHEIEEQKFVDYIHTEDYHTRICDRIKSFGDDVYGIVITIMVLQLVTPKPDLGGCSSISLTNCTSSNSTILNDWELNVQLGNKLVSIDLTFVYLENLISLLLVSKMPLWSNFVIRLDITGKHMQP